MLDRSLTIKHRNGVANAEIIIYQRGTLLYKFTFEGNFEGAVLWANAIGYQDIQIEEEDEECTQAHP